MIKTLRKLARSDKWQLIYSQCKECRLKLFKNASDLTTVQLLFINWLSIYASVNMDIAMKKKYIGREYLKDDLRIDAYLLLRSTLKDEDYTKGHNTKKDKKITPKGIPTILFRKK